MKLRCKTGWKSRGDKETFGWGGLLYFTFNCIFVFKNVFFCTYELKLAIPTVLTKNINFHILLFSTDLSTGLSTFHCTRRVLCYKMKINPFNIKTFLTKYLTRKMLNHLARISSASVVPCTHEDLGDDLVPAGSLEHLLALTVAHDWHGHLTQNKTVTITITTTITTTIGKTITIINRNIFTMK